MQFYCFVLDKESRQYTVTQHPNGTLLEYLRLPMGLKISPDIAQAIMEEVLQGLDVVVYIDDIGIWTNTTHDEYYAALQSMGSKPIH